MPEITVLQIINDTWNLLSDKVENHRRFSKQDILSFINEACWQIVEFKPESKATLKTIPLEMGVMQSIPEEGYQFLSAEMNILPGGFPGDTVSELNLKELSSIVPDWPMHSPSDKVENFMKISDNLKQFYVYPPNTGLGELQVTFSSLHDEIKIEDLDSDPETPLPLGSGFKACVVDYCLFRCYGMQPMAATDNSQSMKFWQSFMQRLGMQNRLNTGRRTANGA